MIARSMRVLLAAAAVTMMEAHGRTADEPPAQGQVPDRALVEAMGNVYRLPTYTAFDWLTARYLKGTLTLEGFARNPLLKQQTQEAATRAAGSARHSHHRQRRARAVARDREDAIRSADCRRQRACRPGVLGVQNELRVAGQK